MREALKWEELNGGLYPRYDARTILGYIAIHRKSFGASGFGWKISFPDGTHFRAKTLDEAKEYVDRWLDRRAKGDGEVMTYDEMRRAMTEIVIEYQTQQDALTKIDDSAADQGTQAATDRQNKIALISGVVANCNEAIGYMDEIDGMP